MRPVDHGRSEELAYRPQWRETRQIATARAVGSIATLLELTMPFLGTRARCFPEGEVGRAKSMGKVASMWVRRMDDTVDAGPH